MKHDLCTNPILASQLPDTDVSPAFIHRHMYARMQHLHMHVIYVYIPSYSTHQLLKSDLYHTASFPHLFPHLFSITCLSPLYSATPFPSPLYYFYPSPIHCYPHTFIWYECSRPPISSSIFLPISLFAHDCLPPPPSAIYHIGICSGGWVVLSCWEILMSSYGIGQTPSKVAFCYTPC